MVESQYKWKKLAATTWKCVPPSQCPECSKEAFVALVSDKPSSIVPFADTEYKLTEECFDCGYLEQQEILTAEEFETFAEENKLPR